MDAWIGRNIWALSDQQRQKIGTAESNQGQLEDKPGQSKEEAVKVQGGNESTGRLLGHGNCTREGGVRDGVCYVLYAQRRQWLL